MKKCKYCWENGEKGVEAIFRQASTIIDYDWYMKSYFSEKDSQKLWDKAIKVKGTLSGW